ncbi:hypothetical protein F4810DRAFT_190821 [Camillea tinctor]|nr:hypothetical protein F4810DRAFT_190821 [Camillea tinctor]
MRAFRPLRNTIALLHTSQPTFTHTRLPPHRFISSSPSLNMTGSTPHLNSSSSDPSNSTRPTSSSGEEQQQQPSHHAPLPLPEPPSQDAEATQVYVGGEGVKLDHLGPLVVHEDGTLSRVANWGEMAEIERENTLRVLGRRNKMRLDALKIKRAAEAEANGKESA